MKSFIKIPPPPAHQGKAINRYAQWYTWAPECRDYLARWSAATQYLPGPALIDLHPDQKYARTYSCRTNLISSNPLMDWIAQVANDLYLLSPPSGVYFFSDMFGTELNRHGFQLLLAALRDALADKAGSEDSTLYAPLGATGPSAGRFPVHADLYTPEMLFNIFDDVSANADSLFLSVLDFENILPTVASIPDEVRLDLLRCIRAPAASDQFDKFYSLLYARQNRWTRELGSALNKCQFRISLFSGEGYLIHDRSWLHGRDAPAGEVSPHRLHRLVFTCSKSQLP